MSASIAFVIESAHHIGTFEIVARSLRTIYPETKIFLIDIGPLCGMRTSAPKAECFDHIYVIPPTTLGSRRPFSRIRWNVFANGGWFAYRRLVKFFRELFQTERYSCVVMMKDHHAVNQAVLAGAKAAGCGTAFLQAGPFAPVGKWAATTPLRNCLRACQTLVERLAGLPYNRGDGMSAFDVIGVASTFYAEKYRASGAAASRIEVIGIPRYDDLLPRAPLDLDQQQASSLAGASGSRRSILYVHQPMSADGKVDAEATMRAERMLAGALARLTQQFDVTVRPHPRTPQAEYRRLCSVFEFAAIEEPGSMPPFIDELRKHSVFVGFYSCALLEALATGASVVALKLPKAAFRDLVEATRTDDLIAMGAIAALTEDDLVAAVERANGDGAPRSPMPALLDELGVLDGGSAARAARMIYAVNG